MGKGMDPKDRSIVQLLLEDGRMKLKTIAKRTGMPITTVHNRLRGLIKRGDLLIRAAPNWKQVGYGVEAILLVNVDTANRRVDQERLARRVAGVPGVLSASVVTGSKDLVVRAVTRDIDELRELVLKKLRGFDGVASTETLVVLKQEESEPSRMLG